MIDQSNIHIKGGKGGDGIVSGRREKFVPQGGPDGGNGGRGGSVFIVGDSGLTSLLGFRYRNRFTGGDGGKGSGRLKQGAKGTAVEIPVPVGTEVWADTDSPTLIGDLESDGQRMLVASGGKGGRGNASYASSTNRFPLLAEQGEPGEEFDIRLELKLLADVGIVGQPNAGKSSLLAAVSGARPKIADYPFTTLEPVLGVVDHRGKDFVMVDIPGLIEGAHKGRGLGLRFLRHVERTRVVVHMLDGTSVDPIDDFRRVNHEMALFSERLAKKPQVIVFNKIDVPEVESRIDSFKAEMGVDPPAVYFVSVVSKKGVARLMDGVLLALAEAPVSRTGDRYGRDPLLPVIKPKPLGKKEVMVAKEAGVYVVLSPAIARVAASVDVEDWSARVQLYHYLDRKGVIGALEDAGVQSGDTVRIGSVDLEWE